ncbi:MAG: hypothetical protein P8Y99_15745 [Calditrichaceae bacterium]
MKSKKTIVLKDYEINVKIKLAALWISVMFCYIYGDYFELYTPDKVTGLLDGTNVLNSPLKLFLASLLMTIPALMTYLSLALKPKLNTIIDARPRAMNFEKFNANVKLQRTAKYSALYHKFS